MFFFILNIIKLRFQLRYHHMNNNSKCDVNFFHADKWQTTQKRTLSSNLCTSRTLKICQYHSSWVTKPVLFFFFHHWIIIILLNCGVSLLHPVGFDPVMSDKSKCDCVFCSKQAMRNASFHNFDTTLNGLRWVVFPKIKIFPVMARFSSLYTGSLKVPPQALAIWAISQQGNYSLEQFSMTVKSNCAIANGTLSDWIKNLVPLFAPMKSETITNCNAQ